jgi:serine/threonine protein kinase, bacterial
MWVRGPSRAAFAAVLKLAAGSSTQIVLPFISLNYPHGVAVDTAGNLYVIDSSSQRVVKLPAG